MSKRVLDGRKLFEPQTGLLIPFNSHSDALLAQLPLQHGVSKQHFNLFLDILRDPSFDMDELSLRSATNIDVRISEHRRELAEERSNKAIASNQTSKSLDHLQPAGIHPVVFDLILDQMTSEMDHFSHEADATPGSPSAYEPPVSRTHELQAGLKRMSLVHRSWTEPSQRALRRRVVLTSRHSLREFARSPACGTGVREFAYKIPKSETCTFFHEASVAREHWSTLASVVTRLTTLRFLCLNIESAHLADLNGLDQVLLAIGNLTSLEGLWLLSARDHCPYLPQLYAAITKLPNLRVLSLRNWTCTRRFGTSDTPDPQEKVLELTPPARLKALQLRDDYLTTPPTFLSWLFQPRGCYSLDALSLQITFSRALSFSSFDPFVPDPNSSTSRIDSSHLLTSLSTLLPTLSCLTIKLFYLDSSTASGTYLHDTDMQVLLSHCTALKRLRLHRLRAGTHVDGVRMPDAGAQLTSPLVLPSSLEELHMHYTYSAINWRTQDLRLDGTLRASELPHLKRVIVSNGETDLEGGKGKAVDPQVDLPKTHKLCARLGVDVSSYDKVDLNRYVIDSLS